MSVWMWSMKCNCHMWHFNPSSFVSQLCTDNEQRKKKTGSREKWDTVWKRQRENGESMKPERLSQKSRRSERLVKATDTMSCRLWRIWRGTRSEENKGERTEWEVWARVRNVWMCEVRCDAVWLTPVYGTDSEELISADDFLPPYRDGEPLISLKCTTCV